MLLLKLFRDLIRCFSNDDQIVQDGILGFCICKKFVTVLLVEKIMEDGVILKFNNVSFRMKVLDEWHSK